MEKTIRQKGGSSILFTENTGESSDYSELITPEFCSSLLIYLSMSFLFTHLVPKGQHSDAHRMHTDDRNKRRGEEDMNFHFAPSLVPDEINSTVI